MQRARAGYLPSAGRPALVLAAPGRAGDSGGFSIIGSVLRRYVSQVASADAGEGAHPLPDSTLMAYR